MIPASILHISVGSPWWVFAIAILALTAHVVAGSAGIISGYGAVAVEKGGFWHRRFGTIFVISMLAMAGMAVYMAVQIPQRGNIMGGLLAAYLVATGWMTVRRPAGQVGRFEVAAMFLALFCAIALTFFTVQAATSPSGTLEGARPPLYGVFAFFAALFASLDLKMIRKGGVSGVDRIARHLWRMCFALFFAAGSFFLGQQKVMPASVHGSPALLVLGFAPLAIMLFWLIKVRWRRRSTLATS